MATADVAEIRVANEYLDVLSRGKKARTTSIYSQKGFLWERGCTLDRGDLHVLRTPNGRSFNLQVWGSLPYLLKKDLKLILNDLLQVSQPGRSGRPAETPTAARVCRTETGLRLVRSQLRHRQEDYGKKKVQHIQSKYKHLPDLYYEDDVEKVVTPEKFE